MGSVWRFPIKIELSHGPAILLLDIHLKECKSAYNRVTCTPMCIAALLTVAKLGNQPRCLSTNKWIKKMWYIYTIEYYSAIKKPKTRHQWLTPAILAMHKAEIGRIVVWSQPQQIVPWYPISTKSQKTAGGVVQGVGPEFKIQYRKKKKKAIKK
jgi:hypothetical protein